MLHIIARLYHPRSLSGSNVQRAARLCQLRYQTTGPNQQTKPVGPAEQAAGSEEDSTPPSAARAIATMGAGGDVHLCTVVHTPACTAQLLDRSLTCSSGSCSSCRCWGVGRLQDGHGGC